MKETGSNPNPFPISGVDITFTNKANPIPLKFNHFIENTDSESSYCGNSTTETSGHGSSKIYHN